MTEGYQITGKRVQAETIGQNISNTGSAEASEELDAAGSAGFPAASSSAIAFKKQLTRAQKRAASKAGGASVRTAPSRTPWRSISSITARWTSVKPSPGRTPDRGRRVQMNQARRARRMPVEARDHIETSLQALARAHFAARGLPKFTEQPIHVGSRRTLSKSRLDGAIL